MSQRTRKEFGDFQTPFPLAENCIRQWWRLAGWTPSLVLEPTCGVGAFVAAAANAFEPPVRIVGVDINAEYAARAVLQASDAARAIVEVHAKDFFAHDWTRELNTPGRILITGNPPWVTSSMLGALQSGNMPEKSNFQGLKGLAALTGKANFDISEWMLLQYVRWLQPNRGAFLVLCKTAVARKIARSIWNESGSPKQALIGIDAKRHFGVAVDACLYFVDFCQSSATQSCEVYVSLEDKQPTSRFGMANGVIVSDIYAANDLQEISGQNFQKWRSGVKHDCSDVLELTGNAGSFKSAVESDIDLEVSHVYPLAKCSDVNAGEHRGRYVLLPQTSLREGTERLAASAPMSWAYLNRHAERLNNRASRIYRGKSPFSVFGIGEYTFRPWKIAIAALYKKLNFRLFGPQGGRPLVFDDTVYFLGFDERADAEAALGLLMSDDAQRFLAAHIFWSDKRPITTEVLNRLDLMKLAHKKGETFNVPPPQFRLL